MKPILTKKLILFAFTIIPFINLKSQVGFNNPNPDPSSVVDIKAVDKGFLIPRMTTIQRQAMLVSPNTPANGLLVFDTDLNRFYFCYNNGTPKWLAVNPWETYDEGGTPTPPVDMFTKVTGNTGIGAITPKSKLSVTTGLAVGTNYSGTVTAPINGAIIQGKVGIGESNPSTELEVSGTVTATNYALTGNNANGPVPTGGIIMWSGSITSIPTGWAICDGLNGTPDLRERFIVGAGSFDNPSVLTTTAYPVGPGGNGNASISHTHDVDPASFATLNTEGTHVHSGTTGGPSSSNDKCSCAGSSGAATDGHTHAFSTDATQGAHTHNIDVPSTTSSNASVTENRPPYYALAFIMKL